MSTPGNPTEALNKSIRDLSARAESGACPDSASADPTPTVSDPRAVHPCTAGTSINQRSRDNIGPDVVGLIVALSAEARSLGVQGLRPGDCVRWQHGWIALSGIGPHNAMRAAERLLACGVDQLANWGVAGALDASLEPGDILIPDRIRCAPDDPGFATDPVARERLVAACSTALCVRRGVLWSAAEPVANQADKRALAASSGAIAVDMEAAPIAAVAARADIPFVAVKAICDPLTRELPRRIVHALDGSDGGLSWRMLAAITFGGPPAWSAARSLAQDFAQARHALASAARLAARDSVAA